VTPRQKVGLVAAGYLAAFLVASAAVAVRLATTTGPDAQAASGMYAFGDALLWGALSVLRILVAPLLTLTFLVCAAMSPYRTPRVALLAAVAMEAAVSAYGGLVWFVPLLVPGR